jgi:lipopolysaccharide/colanic/teichoic acid biosynthesis glycosyltransferase
MIKIPPIIDIKDDLLRRLVMVVAVPIAFICASILFVIIGSCIYYKEAMPQIFKSFKKTWRGRDAN